MSEGKNVSHRDDYYDSSADTEKFCHFSEQKARVIAVFERQYLERLLIEASGNVSEWQLHLTPRNEMLAAELTFIDIRGKETTESITIADANGDSSNLTFTTHTLTFLEK